MATAPNILNYSILQGIVSFAVGAVAPATWTSAHDLGNVIKAEIALDGVESKQHFSRRTGIRSVDVEQVTKKGATLTLDLEEYTVSNLRLALSGDTPVVATPTGMEFKLMGDTAVVGWVKVVGTNTIGGKISFLGKVSVKPSGTLNLISQNDDYDNFSVAMTILADDDGDYGTVTVVEAA
jgi:hypothetical protein